VTIVLTEDEIKAALIEWVEAKHSLYGWVVKELRPDSTATGKVTAVLEPPQRNENW